MGPKAKFGAFASLLSAVSAERDRLAYTSISVYPCSVGQCEGAREAMSALKSLIGFFAVPDDPELIKAQTRALSRQVPLMYGMLLVNSLTLAATHAGSAPREL